MEAQKTTDARNAPRPATTSGGDVAGDEHLPTVTSESTSRRASPFEDKQSTESTTNTAEVVQTQMWGFNSSQARTLDRDEMDERFRSILELFQVRATSQTPGVSVLPLSKTSRWDPYKTSSANQASFSRDEDASREQQLGISRVQSQPALLLVANNRQQPPRGRRATLSDALPAYRPNPQPAQQRRRSIVGVVRRRLRRLSRWLGIGRQHQVGGP